MVKWSRSDLKKKARNLLKTNYLGYLFISLFIVLVEQLPNISNIVNKYRGNGSTVLYSSSSGTSVSVSLIYIIFSIFLGNIILVTARRCILNSIRTNNIDFVDAKPNYDKSSYLNLVSVMFMRNLYIFLWSLLLVIPGIIKSYSYFMVPFILAEDPNVSIGEALNRSTQMTDGHKMDMFVLDLSFIGWFILGFLAFGVGMIFVYPYVYTTKAFLYEELKQELIVD